MARRTKLFAGYQILASPNTQPTPTEIDEIVRCAGGEFILNPTVQHKSDRKIVLITEKKDKKLWKKYQDFYKNIVIVSSEGFMQSIMRQKILFSKYLLT